MKFRLFSKLEFEVSCPVALIESYCFQSDFYANYDLLADRKVEDVNAIGARIPDKQLHECKSIIENTRSLRIFEYNELGLDDFLGLGYETIAKLVDEDLKHVIDQFMQIKGIGLSKTTKVLHTVYPGIIPMVDSMLQEEYRQTVSPGWTEDSSSKILIDYYKNLSVEPTRPNLSEIFVEISRNLPGLTKVRVFDILWWSCLKAKRLGSEKRIHWSTVK